MGTVENTAEGKGMSIIEVAPFAEDRTEHWEKRLSEGETIVNLADKQLDKIPIPGQLVLPMHEMNGSANGASALGRTALQG